MKFLLAAFFGLFSGSVVAQTPAYFFRNNIPVQHAGAPLAHAWAGGLNSAQFSKIDLNLDGTEDLFVFDRVQNRINTFVAVQQSGNWHWQYAPEYATTFPEGIYQWALLADYDLDGRKDIFCFTPGGAKVYHNLSTPQTGLQWELASPLLTHGTQININILATDIAAINDIDNDGDLDILMAESAKVSYFRNQSVENNGAAGLGPFVRETSNWGGIRECGCAAFVFGNGASCRVQEGNSANSMQMHAGNSMLAIDLNGDLDKDILWGDVSCSELVKLENVGSATNAEMTGFETNYPGNTQAANELLYPAAFYEDLDFDGKKDLLVGTNVTGSLSDTVVNFSESVWQYHNTGTTAIPEFTFLRKDFLQGEMIDRGEGAMPAFADMDGDGDLDMLVGNYYGTTAFGARATLALYTNTGTPTQPSFALTNPDFLNLSGHKFMNVRPGFADINADGNLDLYISSTEFTEPFIPFTGRVRYFLNSAPTGQPMNLGPMQTLSNGLTDTVDDLPLFFDIDNNGTQDLLVAKSSGSVKYYRNTGTNASPNYVLQSATFGGIADNFYRRKPSLAIADADADGLPDLITADDSSAVRIYSNFRDQTGTFVSDQQFVYDSTTNTRVTPVLGRRLHVAAADLDADGKPEIVVGSQAGGLVMLSRTSTINAIQEAAATWPVQLYPNPAQNLVQVQSKEPVSVTILDILGRQTGQELPTPFAQNHELNISNLAPGVYLLRLETQTGKTQVKRLVVAR